MHVSFQRTLIGLHLLCLIAIVCSRKRDKDYSQTSDNEIYQKTNIITVKFPKIQFPSNSTKIEPNITRRRINTNVQPVEGSVTYMQK